MRQVLQAARRASKTVQHSDCHPGLSSIFSRWNFAQNFRLVAHCSLLTPQLPTAAAMDAMRCGVLRICSSA